MKNHEKCVARLIRASRTRCARSRRLNLSLIGGRRPALPPHPLSNCAAPGAAPRRALRRALRRCRCRGAQNFKFRGWCFLLVLSCCSDVVELDLSFQKSIFSLSNSSGVARTSARSVFAQFWVRRRVSAVRFGGIFGSFCGL